MNLRNLFPLAESPQSDLRKDDLAQSIVSALIGHFLHGSSVMHYGLQAVRFGGGQPVLYIEGRNVDGLEAPYNKVRFLFQTSDDAAWNPKGAFGRFQSGVPYVSLTCIEDVNDIDHLAKQIIHAIPIHAILKHEVIHYLDHEFVGLPLKGSNVDYADPDSVRRYHNNAAENNAYFHNVAAKLINFIRVGGDLPATQRARMAQATGITADFKQTLANLTDPNAHGHGFSPVAKHLRLMDEQNRRAMIRRLYGLHHEAVALLSDSQSDPTD